VNLSCVVVTWNSAGVVGECIRSLQGAARGVNMDVIVVDNGSRDETLDIVRATAPDARIIANPSNQGLAAANNQGIRASQSPYILICNPDVIFEPGSVKAMLDLVERRPKAGWVVPRLTYEDGTTQTSVGDLPTFFEAFAGRQVSRRRDPGRPTGFWWDGWEPDEEQLIGRSHEAAYIVRRAAVDAVGLQDPRYVLDWEGTDWAERFRRAGWELWVEPAAQVIHLGGTSIRTIPFRWIVSQHRGMYTYFADRTASGWKPFLVGAIMFRALLKMGLVAAGLPMYQWAHRDRRGTPTMTAS
jgi:N-acetylglucosaminyl-diphospho-decaprenol L-rhamnosyltransferase